MRTIIITILLILVLKGGVYCYEAEYDGGSNNFTHIYMNAATDVGIIKVSVGRITIVHFSELIDNLLLDNTEQYLITGLYDKKVIIKPKPEARDNTSFFIITPNQKTYSFLLKNVNDGIQGRNYYIHDIENEEAISKLADMDYLYLFRNYEQLNNDYDVYKTVLIKQPIYKEYENELMKIIINKLMISKIGGLTLMELDIENKKKYPIKFDMKIDDCIYMKNINSKILDKPKIIEVEPYDKGKINPNETIKITLIFKDYSIKEMNNQQINMVIYDCNSEKYKEIEMKLTKEKKDEVDELY